MIQLSYPKSNTREIVVKQVISFPATDGLENLEEQAKSVGNGSGL